MVPGGRDVEKFAGLALEKCGHARDKSARWFLEGNLPCLCLLFFSFLLTSYHVDMCLYPILYTRYVLPIGNWVSRPLCMEYNEGPSFTRLLKGANVPTPWIVFITDNARFHLASMIWINAIPCFTWYD